MKMNNIINKFLLAGDKVMPEMLLRQSGFTYSDCGSITKNQNKNTKLKKKQKTLDISIGMNYKRPVLNMIWCMEISRF